MKLVETLDVQKECILRLDSDDACFGGPGPSKTDKLLQPTQQASTKLQTEQHVVKVGGFAFEG